MAIIIKPPVSGGGGGAVDSVNGQTGVVRSEEHTSELQSH